MLICVTVGASGRLPWRSIRVEHRLNNVLAFVLEMGICHDIGGLFISKGDIML